MGRRREPEARTERGGKGVASTPASATPVIKTKPVKVSVKGVTRKAAVPAPPAPAPVTAKARAARTASGAPFDAGPAGRDEAMWKAYYRAAAAHKKAGANPPADVTEELQRCRNVILERYLPLVRAAAERLRSRLPAEVDPEDLMSEGVF